MSEAEGDCVGRHGGYMCLRLKETVLAGMEDTCV